MLSTFLSVGLVLSFMSQPFLMIWMSAIFLLLLPQNLLMINGGPNNEWSAILSILSLLICYLVLVSQSNNSQFNSKNSLITMSMALSLIMCFNAETFLSFYIFYEMSAVIVFLMIMMLGYQPERLMAGLLVLMFTALSSLPLLFFLLFLKEIMATDSTWGLTYISGGVGPLGNMIYLLIILGFLVKFPLYLLHFWLPKAHVEASAGGSMLLAGILLKLGSYGLYFFSPFLSINTFTMSFTFFFALGGGILSSLICIRQKDMKVLIAYSSVTHMSLVICAMLSKSETGLMGALMMSVAHGLISSGLFFHSGILYNITNSRLFMFNSGGLNWAPFFSVLWFIFSVCNMGAPPSLNFWSELVMMFSVFSYYNLALCYLAFILFFSVVYNILLYMFSQNVKEEFSYSMNLNLSEKEYMVSFAHLLFFFLFMLLFLKI